MSRTKPSPSAPEPFVVRIYRLGLRLYPASYRQRFGPEMEQVFRDQWRAARSSGSPASSIALLLRTVADLVRTSIRERCVSLRNAVDLRRPLSPAARLRWSLGAGLPVTIVVVGLAIGVTLAMPSTYRSDARVLVRYWVSAPAETPPPQGPAAIAQELERLTSPQVLARVAEKLSLNERWSAKYLPVGTLHTAETIEILRDHVELSAVRNSPVFRISVHDEDRQLASDIANAMAEAYVSLPPSKFASTSPPSAPEPGLPASPSASIIHLAEPGLKPTRPNVPLNLFVGLAIGGSLGLLTSGAVWLALRRRASRLAPPASPA